MSGEKTTTLLTPVQEIEQALEEKTAKLSGMEAEVQKARNFLAQAEPQLFGLHGAVNSLKELLVKMTKK